MLSLADFAVFGALNPVIYSGNTFPERLHKLRARYQAANR
jgi:hypothetical protein